MKLRSKIHHLKSPVLWCLILICQNFSQGNAGEFFFDPFDAQASDPPAEWVANFGGGGTITSDGYEFPIPNSPCCLGAVIGGEIYDNASVRTRISPGPYYLTGITARGPVGGGGFDWYFAGVRYDGNVGVFAGREVIDFFTLDEFDLLNDDVNLQLDMYGDLMSFRAWLNDDPIPEDPQITIELDPLQEFYSSEGRLGIWANGNSVPLSFRHFEVTEAAPIFRQVDVAGHGTIGTETYTQRPNLALDGVATASSTFAENFASKAIDGLESTMARTDAAESSHWWQVELGNTQDIHSLEILNSRADGKRLVDGGGFRIKVLDESGKDVYQQDIINAEFSQPFLVDLDENTIGNAIRLEKLEPVLEDGAGTFQLREVRVFSNNFIAEDSSKFTFEIDQANAAFDVLHVPGTFDPNNGVLEVQLLSGSPQLGSTFQLIQAEEILSDFVEVELPSLDENLAWDASNLAIDGRLRVIRGLCDPSTNGDLDGNGIVEFADFLVLSANFGTEVASDVLSHELGDIDCNGIVDFADFLGLSSQFGSDAQNLSAVPEPRFSLTVLICAAAVMRTRRHRCRMIETSTSV